MGELNYLYQFMGGNHMATTEALKLVQIIAASQDTQQGLQAAVRMLEQRQAQLIQYNATRLGPGNVSNP